ncbi:MAG: glycoside hydrolase family 88 protein [bacterium]|nr:glycoside hydrolase family 88 protein [bacterium]
MEHTFKLTPKQTTWANEVMNKIMDKLSWVSEKSKDKIPYRTDETGTHDTWEGFDENRPDQGICWWTNGFWPGLMWLMYQACGDEKYAGIARIAQEKLHYAFTCYYGLHHDVGFMYLLGDVADYRLTGSEEGKKYGLLAAQMLAGRFHPNGHFIRAWNDIPGEPDKDTRGWAIIDCMMNIQLLFWAYDETKDYRFRQIAMMHADTAMKYFVREDGSVKHIVEFHPETGEYMTSHGGQGYTKGSSWSRGQAWAIYGYALAYRHTGKKEYLDTAKKVAHYFIANIKEDGTVLLDFRQPETPAWEDGCGACVAASGLLEIAREVPEPERALYSSAAVKILKNIDEKHCCYDTSGDSFVLNCSAAYECKEHHVTMVYADYYYMEAIMKLQGYELNMW